MKKRIKNYQILEEIATGGQATVYRVWDTRTNQTLALKVMHPHLSRDPDYLRRFEREASLASSLDHPNVVRIFEVGRQGESHFIAMEFLPTTLHHLLKAKGRLGVRRAVDIALQISLGLEAAAEKGIVHRDIKPQNILLDRKGVAKITDFGIARTEQVATMTHTGLVMGTPQYMAPEQARGFPPDTRSDIYSIGVLLYQMLTGELPFRGETPWEIIRQHIEERQKPVGAVRPEVPAGLSAAVDRCLEKDPNARYQAPKDLAAALEAARPAPVAARSEDGHDSALDDGGSDEIEPITLPLPPPVRRGLLVGMLSRRRLAALAVVGVLVVGMRFPAGGLLGVSGLFNSRPPVVLTEPTPTAAAPTPTAQPTPGPMPTVSPTAVLKLVGPIPPGGAETIGFTVEETEKSGITELHISTVEALPSISITVDTVPGQYFEYFGSPPGTVYSYLGISLAGASPGNLGALGVSFRVPQSWLQARRLQPANMAMFAFDGRWTRLPTGVVSQGLDAAAYSADVLGYSLFAIAGIPSESATPTPVPTPRATPSPTPTPNPTPTPTPGPSPTVQPDRLVINYQGRGPTESSTFNMTSSPWKLQYRTSWSGPLMLRINTTDGLKTIVDQKIQADVLYTTYVYGSDGPLTIAATNAPTDGRWVVWAVDQPRTEDPIAGGPADATFSHTALSQASSPPLTMQADPWLLRYWTSWSGFFTLKGIQDGKVVTLVDGPVAAGASYETYIYGASGNLHLVATDAPAGGRWIVWGVDNPKVQVPPGSNVIFTDTATGTVQTPPFTATDSPWRLVYTTSWSGLFSLNAVGGDQTRALVNQKVQAGVIYETYIYGLTGRMHLSVGVAPPDGAWSVSITKSQEQTGEQVSGGPPGAVYARSGTGNANTAPFDMNAFRWRLAFSAQWTGRVTVRIGGETLASQDVIRGVLYSIPVSGLTGSLYFTVSDAPPDGKWIIWVVEDQSTG